jgi:hypothetical protein
MAPKNPRTIALVIQLPIELAEDIFRESGNLAISEFPATIEFAESLAEVLNFEHKEDTRYPEPTMMVKNRESIPVPARRKR